MTGAIDKSVIRLNLEMSMHEHGQLVDLIKLGEQASLAATPSGIDRKEFAKKLLSILYGR